MMPAEIDESACRQRLRQGVVKLGLAMDEVESARLLQFLQLLVKWNKAFNLTAVRDPLEMVDRHLLDSLALLPHLCGRRCLDMGTGPGLPGIPLAVMRPDMVFVLLDSNGKKIRFVRQAVLELGLENVEPVHARLENYRPAEAFDALVARAFAALPDILDLTGRLRQAHTVLLAMKGKLPREELAAYESGRDYQVIPLPSVSGDRERCLIRFPAPGA